MVCPNPAAGAWVAFGWPPAFVAVLVSAAFSNPASSRPALPEPLEKAIKARELLHTARYKYKCRYVQPGYDIYYEGEWAESDWTEVLLGDKLGVRFRNPDGTPVQMDGVGPERTLHVGEDGRLRSVLDVEKSNGEAMKSLMHDKQAFFKPVRVIRERQLYPRLRALLTQEQRALLPQPGAATPAATARPATPTLASPPQSRK